MCSHQRAKIEGIQYEIATVASRVPVCLNGRKSKAVGATVSEESERASSGPEGSGGGVDPTAVALALVGASRERADSLVEQEALLKDQRHHLHEQLKQIHLDIFEKWLAVALRLATLCVGVAVACFVGAAVWQAAHDDGLVIEAFSVPPELAARGLTGEVVATQLLANSVDLPGDIGLRAGRIQLHPQLGQ